MQIKTRIDGEFSGTNNQVLFKLANGQIWQHIGYRHRYRYRYAPRVQIVRSGPYHSMIVDGFPDPVKVRRIR